MIKNNHSISRGLLMTGYVVMDRHVTVEGWTAALRSQRLTPSLRGAK
jgi:hypothetical protein